MITAAAQRDVALARAASEGRAEAVRDLAERLACVPALVRSIHGQMSAPLSRDEIAEITQNVLTAMWSKLDRYDGRGALETWAYGFCSTEILKFLERRQRRSQLVFGLEEERLVDAARSEALQRLEFEWVHVALDRIGPPADEIVRLKHFEDLTFDDIGKRLAISPNTAKTQYYRAVQRLRELLQPLWRKEEESRR